MIKKVAIFAMGLALPIVSIYGESCGCPQGDARVLCDALGATAIVPKSFENLNNPAFDKPFAFHSVDNPVFNEQESFPNYRMIAFEDLDNRVRLTPGQITQFADALVYEDFIMKDSDGESFNVREKTEKKEASRKSHVDFSAVQSNTSKSAQNLVAWEPKRTAILREDEPATEDEGGATETNP